MQTQDKNELKEKGKHGEKEYNRLKDSEGMYALY